MHGDSPDARRADGCTDGAIMRMANRGTADNAATRGKKRMPLRDIIRPRLGSSTAESVPGILRAIRQHLEMDVAFVSRFAEGLRVFEHVDSGLDAPLIRAGDTDPLEETFCARLADGRLPLVINDSSQYPDTAKLALCRRLPVGAYLGAPIVLPNRQLYGTVCCFSRRPMAMTNRDQAIIRIIADLIAGRVQKEADTEQAESEMIGRVRQVLDGDGLSMVYQPIVDVANEQVAGYECLSRFSAAPLRGPDEWFREAAAVGLCDDLELLAIRKALNGLDGLGQDPYVSLNISPGIPAERLIDSLHGFPLERIVLEITEHEAIEEYDAVRAMLAPLRKLGVRIAIDDAGAGYSSFRHILRLQPHFIKLDISLTRDIDTDPGKRALATAVVRFGNDTGSEIVAEGVETAAEFAALRELGAHKAQGYYLGHPKPLAAAIADGSTARRLP